MGINVTVTQQGVEDCCHCLLSCWLNLEHIHSRTHTATEDVMVEGIQSLQGRSVCVCVFCLQEEQQGERETRRVAVL